MSNRRPVIRDVVRRLSIAAAVLAVASRSNAEVAEPAPRPDSSFDFMNVLSNHGLHDLKDEDWNAYGQITDIYTLKLGFPAKYTNLNGTPNSLLTSQELSFTETATLYLGLRPWPGAEAFLDPEVIAEKPLSNLKGLGGVIQNFELQKSGNSYPTPYLSRSYIRQTIPLGGEHIERKSDPTQLAQTDTRRHLVLVVGEYSVLDFFDKNNVSGDLRHSFFNMAFLTYAAYDFAADARGYAWGGLAELDYDDWTVRFGRFTPPQAPNQLPLDFHIDKVYGDQLEFEHDHKILGREGAIRVLGYRNVENMGRFSDAIAVLRADPTRNATNCPTGSFSYGSNNAGAPDMCQVRRSNVKVGLGVSVEQRFSDDVAAFVRAMYSDGQTEVYSYTSTDSSLSFGATIAGSVWKRPMDMVGLGWSQGWISPSHAQYLNLGGIDGFIGDGKITQASEGVFEVFYRLEVASSTWCTLDYQRIWNPAYNADRGPVDIFGGRVHVEF